jgi:hypothetical protein
VLVKPTRNAAVSTFLKSKIRFPPFLPKGCCGIVAALVSKRLPFAEKAKQLDHIVADWPRDWSGLVPAFPRLFPGERQDFRKGDGESDAPGELFNGGFRQPLRFGRTAAGAAVVVEARESALGATQCWWLAFRWKDRRPSVRDSRNRAPVRGTRCCPAHCPAQDG